MQTLDTRKVKSKPATGEGNAPRFPGFKNSRVRAYVDELQAALKEERSVGACLKSQRDELLAALKETSSSLDFVIHNERWADKRAGFLAHVKQARLAIANAEGRAQ